jgi:hypothetical protein
LVQGLAFGLGQIGVDPDDFSKAVVGALEICSRNAQHFRYSLNELMRWLMDSAFISTHPRAA